MKQIKNNKIETNKLIIVAYLFTSILLAVPSVIYLIKNKTIYHFTQVFNYTFVKPQVISDRYINAILYISLFFILFFLYFAILKNVNKIFKTRKCMLIFIAIVGIIFSIIIPTTSLDVYSYIGNGWVDSNYQENPYYTSVQEIWNQNGPDEMLGKVARCWRNEPVVYGPVWSIICKTLTSLSFGNITIALYIFKLASFLIFLGSCIVIYKVTNKKFFVALFALNPYILFEFLSNVHNDIFLVFFVLLAIYFVKRKENIALSVACIAIATGIKYLSILLLPFILIYALRKESIKQKIIKTIFYFIEFILIILAFYMLYIRDLQVLSGIFVQQNKYGRSIFLALWYFLNGDEQALRLIKTISLIIFAISYLTIVLKLFFKTDYKNIKLRKVIKTYQVFLLIFTFLLITNFNPWYVIWLFPTLFWQNSTHIKNTLYLSIGAISSYTITYATGIDNETVGIPYLIIMIIIPLILYSKDIQIKKDKVKVIAKRGNI